MEAIGTALTYDQLLKAHLEELARARANGTAGSVDFAELLSNEQHCFKMQAIHQHTKPIKEKPVKQEKEKKEKADKPPGWLPRKEFLKKKAEERRKETAALASSSDKKADRSRSRSRRRSRSRKRSHGRKKSPVPENPMKQRKRR